MDLDALLEGHRVFYGPNSEKRLATWLREDIQMFLNRMSGGDSNVPPLSPPASAARNPDKKLTPAELAKRLNRTIKTIANWRSSNTGPRWHKIAGSVYYFESDVDSWEQDQIDGGKD